MAPSSASSSLPLVDPPAQTERLARSAGLAGSATLVSRILGLVRDQVLAALFGASNDMDAFIVAFRIPNLVRDLFAEGAMSAAFVPTFTRHLALRGKADAWRLGSNVLNALAIATGVLVLLGGLFATPLVTAYARDFQRIPGKLELTISLTRVMLPFLTLAAVAAAIMGMLNSLRHYFVPALSPATFNVATIVGALLLVPVMPLIGLPRIMAIAIATLIGGLGQIAVQWPLLRREGFRHVLVLDPRDPGLQQVLLLMGPGTLGLAATQVNLFVNTLLATSQGPGAVSWLQYAFRLMYLPIGLFGVSIATAVLPAVSRSAALEDPEAIIATIARGIRLMLMVNVPATAGLLVLAPQIVQLLFERGHFQPTDTLATAAAVRYYAVGLVGYSTARIASPVFYVLRQSRTAVMLSTVSIVVNLALSVALVQALGFRGLALATSLAAIVNGGLALVFLRRRLGRIEGARLAQTFAKTLAAAAAMGLVVVGTYAAVSILVSGPATILRAVRLGVTIGVGLVALGAAARLLGIEEFDGVVQTLRQKMRLGQPD